MEKNKYFWLTQLTEVDWNKKDDEFEEKGLPFFIIFDIFFWKNYGMQE